MITRAKALKKVDAVARKLSQNSPLWKVEIVATMAFRQMVRNSEITRMPKFRLTYAAVPKGDRGVVLSMPKGEWAAVTKGK